MRAHSHDLIWQQRLKGDRKCLRLECKKRVDEDVESLFMKKGCDLVAIATTLSRIVQTTDDMSWCASRTQTVISYTDGIWHVDLQSCKDALPNQCIMVPSGGVTSAW